MSFPSPSVFLAAAALFLPRDSAGTHEERNLLRNAGFEEGGKSSVADWMTVFPQQIAHPNPKFLANDRSPHGDGKCGSIEVEYDGGYTSFTQSVHPSKNAKSVHFEGWCRIDASGPDGAASLMIYFTVPGSKDGGSMAQSRRLTDAKEWTQLSIDAAVPEGATEMTVRCGVYGPCSASFDDVALTLSDEVRVPCKLAVAQGDYQARSNGSSDQPWINLSIPFPFGGQTPLAIRATSDPPGKVIGLAVDKDRENRPLKILLSPMKASEEVSVRVETLALLHDRPTSDGKGVALGKAKVPKDVQMHLSDAPGVDVDAPAVKKVAASLPRKDFGDLMSGLQELLSKNLEYDGGKSQGAKECLETGKAVCTGYANTAASILIACKVPARILACTGLHSRLQEHYIVEAWSSELGWSRMESTMARFPWPDSENLVLRIIYPDAERSQVDVPLFKRGSSGLQCNFKMGKDECWQGGEEVGSYALAAADVQCLETAARAAFENLTRRPADGAKVFLPDDEAAEKLGESAAALLDAARSWAGE